VPPIARLLALLPHDVLIALAETFDVPVSGVRSAAALRDVLLAERLTVGDVLPELSLPVLREVCAGLGVQPARSLAATALRVRDALDEAEPVRIVAPSPSDRTVAPAPPRAPARRTFVALDVETADHGRDSVCQIAVIRVEAGAVVRRAVHYVRPPRSTFAFSYLHGITWDRVRREPTFAELWPTLAPVFDGAAFIAAHNAPFDRSALTACCTLSGLSVPALPFLCTVQLARATWQLRPTKLSDVCRHLGIPLQHHEAGSDAEACARIVLSAGADLA
jgi:DNA polymerase-3 subunit epsilon